MVDPIDSVMDGMFQKSSRMQDYASNEAYKQMVRSKMQDSYKSGQSLDGLSWEWMLLLTGHYEEVIQT